MDANPKSANSFPKDADVPTSPLVQRTFGQPTFHTDADVCALAFTTDGTLCSIDEAGILIHWTPDGGVKKRCFTSDLETLWAFSADATLLASGNDDVLLWDTADGQLLARISQPKWVTALAFSPDGQTLATGHDDGSVRFFDVRSHRLIGDVPAHTRAISALAFNAEGSRIATAGECCTIRTWDTVTHKQVQEYASHTDRIPALAWHPDGTVFVSAGWDTSARVWKPDVSIDPVMLLNSHSEQVHAATFSPDGTLLATADSDYAIHLWSSQTTAKVRHVLRGHSDDIRCLAFNPEGTRLASAGADRVIHLWDTATGQLVAGPNPIGKHALAFSDGGTPVLVSTGGASVTVWNVQTRETIAPTGAIAARAVACSENGHWLAVSGTDQFIHVYDRTQHAAPAKLLEATKPPIGHLAFSADGNTLAMTSQSDGLVWLWNPATTSGNPELILIEAADNCTLEGLAFHPNNTWVAVGGVDVMSTGDRDGAVCVWDSTTKQRVLTFDTGVYDLAFDPKGRYLAGAGVSEAVYLWDMEKQEEAYALEGHLGRVNCVAFSRDGSYLLSGGDDGTVRVGDLLSGRLVVACEFDTGIQGLAFNTDGSMLYTANSNTTCFELNWQAMLEE